VLLRAPEPSGVPGTVRAGTQSTALVSLRGVAGRSIVSRLKSVVSLARSVCGGFGYVFSVGTFGKRHSVACGLVRWL